jgi:predicted RNA methylase
MQKKLKQIIDQLLAEPLDNACARNAAYDLHAYFVSIVDLKNDSAENNDHIKTNNGLAISTNAAAFCTIDFLRTRSFLLGIKKAIKDCLAIDPNKPVELMYAGTGPFATLALPLMAYFTESQLQFVLLEINDNTIRVLKSIIKKLGAEKYVKTIVQCDASIYTFEKNIQPAIIVSETMKPALYKEPQVMIVVNLIQQCAKEPIIIPQSISIDLASINSTNKEIVLLLKLIDFNAETALQLANPSQCIPIFNEGIQIEIKRENKSTKDRISLLTTIKTYDNYSLNFKESGLTLPCYMDTLNIADKDVKLLVKYRVGEYPGFSFEKMDMN